MTIFVDTWGTFENETSMNEHRAEITLFEHLDPSVPEGSTLLASKLKKLVRPVAPSFCVYVWLYVCLKWFGLDSLACNLLCPV